MSRDWYGVLIISLVTYFSRNDPCHLFLALKESSIARRMYEKRYPHFPLRTLQGY